MLFAFVTAVVHSNISRPSVVQLPTAQGHVS